MKYSLISVNLKDKASLKNAILTFKAQMHEIYKTGELIDQVTGFFSEECKLFQHRDLANFPQLLYITRFIDVLAPNYQQFSGFDEQDFTNPELLENIALFDKYLAFSHFAVFQHALEHEELTELVVNFCKELVEYSIQVDSSNELFFSSNQYFGINILTLLVEKHHQYAYMLGEFITPNSDNFDAYDQLNYHCTPFIKYLVFKYGYQDFILDIFANCRFNYLWLCCPEWDEHFRIQIGETREKYNLLKCFLEDERRYIYYKQAFLASLKNRPIYIDREELGQFNLYHLFESNYDALIELYRDEDTGHFNAAKAKKNGFDIDVISIEDDDFADFSEFNLHGVTIAQDIAQLVEQAYEIVKSVPLKALYYYNQPIFDDNVTAADLDSDPFYQAYQRGNEYEDNKAFFLALPAGEQVLDYIENNRCQSILDDIQAINIRKFAFENKLTIYRRFEHFGSDGFQLSDDLNQDIMLTDIIEHFVTPYLHPESYDIDDAEENEQAQKCLRVIDILTRLHAKKYLSHEEKYALTHTFELCSAMEATKRYTRKDINVQEIQQRIYQLINDPLIDSFGTYRLDEINDFYQKDEAIFAQCLQDIILRAYQDTDADLLAHIPHLKQHEYANGAQLLAVAYVLNKQSRRFSNNAKLTPLWDFYSQNLFKTLYWMIECQHSLNANDIDQLPALMAQLQDYVNQQGQQPTTGLFAKLFQRKKSQAKTSPTISKEQALALTNQLLTYKASESKKAHSKLLDVAGFQMLLSSMLYAQKVAPKLLQQQIASLYQLILTLYPNAVLLMSANGFFAAGDQTHLTTKDEIEGFYDYLTDLGIDEKYAFLFKILFIQKENPYKTFDNQDLKASYDAVLNIYRNKDKVDFEATGMLAKREQTLATAVVQAVELLDKNNRKRFLSNMEKMQ